jgi:hypothetical protein
MTTAGPCSEARAEAERRCADAERKMAAADTQQERLRELRREDALLAQVREADARSRDRRLIAETKDEAQRTYRTAIGDARTQGEVQTAAAEWLHVVDRLNRQARVAGARADDLARRAAELQQQLPAAEIAADAARIAAEAAEVACAEARQAAIECEETVGGRARPTVEPHGDSIREAGRLDQVRSASQATSPGGTAAVPATGPGRGTLAQTAPGPDEPAIGNGLRELLSSDRQPVLRLALALAEETGLEAGRLQLLLLELREAVTAGALADNALHFPEQHPFWGQFNAAGATRIAATLASLGFRFDGVSGWADGRAPQVRDLAMALSYSGFDPRSLRRPAGQAAIDALWHGTVLLAAEWLLARAPKLDPKTVVDSLGQRAARLSELWAIWGQVRPLLAR